MTPSTQHGAEAASDNGTNTNGSSLSPDTLIHKVEHAVDSARELTRAQSSVWQTWLRSPLWLVGIGSPAELQAQLHHLVDAHRDLFDAYTEVAVGWLHAVNRATDRAEGKTPRPSGGWTETALPAAPPAPEQRRGQQRQGQAPGKGQPQAQAQPPSGGNQAGTRASTGSTTTPDVRPAARSAKAGNIPPAPGQGEAERDAMAPSARWAEREAALAPGPQNEGVEPYTLARMEGKGPQPETPAQEEKAAAIANEQAKRRAAYTPVPETHIVEQSSPPPGPIKGNVNRLGEKLYHLPGTPQYDQVKAEQTFATEDEARAAGFKPAFDHGEGAGNEPSRAKPVR